MFVIRLVFSSLLALQLCPASAGGDTTSHHADIYSRTTFLVADIFKGATGVARRLQSQQETDPLADLKAKFKGLTDTLESGTFSPYIWSQLLDKLWQQGARNRAEMVDLVLNKKANDLLLEFQITANKMSEEDAKMFKALCNAINSLNASAMWKLLEEHVDTNHDGELSAGEWSFASELRTCCFEKSSSYKWAIPPPALPCYEDVQKEMLKRDHTPSFEHAVEAFWEDYVQKATLPTMKASCEKRRDTKDPAPKPLADLGLTAPSKPSFNHFMRARRLKHNENATANQWKPLRDAHHGKVGRHHKKINPQAKKN